VQELLVHLAQQADRHGEALTNASEPVLERHHVVAHRCSIVSRVRGRNLASFEAQQLADVGLRALDPRAQDRLEP
jgi:hypothetical protein